METRMTDEQWEDLSLEDKKALKTLGILSLVKPLKKKTKPQYNLPKPYILLKISTCSICETTFDTYFRMSPFSSSSLQGSYSLKAEHISFKDILPKEAIKKEKGFCSGCLYCYKVLSKETKKELIKRIIIATGGR